MNTEINQQFEQSVTVRIILAAFGKVRVSDPVVVSTLKYETIADILNAVYRQTNTLSPTDLEHWRLENRLDLDTAVARYDRFQIDGMEFFLAVTRSRSLWSRSHTSLSVGDLIQINPEVGEESTWLCTDTGWERFKGIPYLNS